MGEERGRLGVFGGWRNEYPAHACGFGGGDPAGGILEDEAIFGVNAKSSSGFEKRIWGRFSVEIVFGADNGVEDIGDSEGLEGGDDD